jgi:hypothetical protein
MTPEERKLLIDTHNKLEEFLQVYYRYNFPKTMVVNKDLEVKGDTTLGNATIGTLNVKDKAGFFGATAIAQQPTIAKPTITGVASVDINNLKTATDAIIDRLKAYGLIA